MVTQNKKDFVPIDLNTVLEFFPLGKAPHSVISMSDFQAAADELVLGKAYPSFKMNECKTLFLHGGLPIPYLATILDACLTLGVPVVMSLPDYNTDQDYYPIVALERAATLRVSNARYIGKELKDREAFYKLQAKEASKGK